MIAHEIYDNLFGINYILAYNFKTQEDFLKLKKILEQKCGCIVDYQELADDEDALCQVVEPISGHCIILILLRSFKHNSHWYGRLSHECLHASEYGLGHRGIKYNKHTKEVYAYNLDMLIKNFFDKKTSDKILKKIKK